MNIDAAQRWKKSEKRLVIVQMQPMGKLSLVPKQEKKSLREYMEDNDPLNKLEFWWQKASLKRRKCLKEKDQLNNTS